MCSAFPAELDAVARAAFAWAGVTLTARFWGAAFDGALRGAHRFRELNATLVLERVLYGVAAAVAAGPLEAGPVGVAVAMTGATVAGQLVKGVVALRSLDGLRLSPGAVDRATWREITSYGGWASLTQIGVFLENGGLRALISAMLGSATLGQFNVLMTVVQLLSRLVSGTNDVIAPLASATDARGDRAQLQRMYVSGSKWILSLITPPTIVAGVLAAPLLRVWIGPELAPLGGALAALLAIQWLEQSFGTGNMIALGTGAARPIGIAYIVAGVVALGSAWAWDRRRGTGLGRHPARAGDGNDRAARNDLDLDGPLRRGRRRCVPAARGVPGARCGGASNGRRAGLPRRDSRRLGHAVRRDRGGGGRVRHRRLVGCAGRRRARPAALLDRPSPGPHGGDPGRQRRTMNEAARVQRRMRRERA